MPSLPILKKISKTDLTDGSFYWLKALRVYEPAQWKGGYWWLIGTEIPYDHGDEFEVGPEIVA